MVRAYLLLVAIGLVPIALSYGLAPQDVLPRIAKLQVQGTDQLAILRAIMGLYLGMAGFLAIAAFRREWRGVAVIWTVFFLLSLAAGRLLSIALDGLPSPLFLFFLAAELLNGVLGLAVHAREVSRTMQ
jgi:hypothetical protein